MPMIWGGGMGNSFCSFKRQMYVPYLCLCDVFCVLPFLGGRGRGEEIGKDMRRFGNKLEIVCSLKRQRWFHRAADFSIEAFQPPELQLVSPFFVFESFLFELSLEGTQYRPMMVLYNRQSSSLWLQLVLLLSSRPEPKSNPIFNSFHIRVPPHP